MSSSLLNRENVGIFITSKNFKKLTRIDGGIINQNVSFLSASPSGNKLIFTMSGQVWMMNIESDYALSHLQELISGSGGTIQSPIWSPEGKYIAFVTYGGTGRSIWTAGRTDQIITFWNVNSKKRYDFNLSSAFPSWVNRRLYPGANLSWVK